MTSVQVPLNTLRQTSRFITTHSSTAQASFTTNISPNPPPMPLPDGSTLSLLYATSAFPVPPSSDLQTYTAYAATPPGFTIPNGTTFYQIDMPPGSKAAPHRTRSLDYCIVVEGSVRLVLDGEEARVLDRGDTVVQRGTKHSWENVSEEGWARILFVLLDAESVVVDGEELGEDFGGMV